MNNRDGGRSWVACSLVLAFCVVTLCFWKCTTLFDRHHLGNVVFIVPDAFTGIVTVVSDSSTQDNIAGDTMTIILDSSGRGHVSDVVSAIGGLRRISAMTVSGSPIPLAMPDDARSLTGTRFVPGGIVNGVYRAIVKRAASGGP